MKRLFFWIFLILLLSLPVTLPLTKAGYFPTHDGEWAVVRLAEMHRELKDGQAPPRWSDFLNHGFGYPLFQYSYPLPYYLGEVLHLVGFGLVDSIKTLFLFSVILSGISMFLLGRELLGEKAGIIASVLYMYAPYRLVNIYMRGSLGESLSFILFPLLFWMTLKLILSPKLSNIARTSLVFAALILTHNIMALIFTPSWLVFIFFALKYYYENLQRYLLKIFLPTIALGLGIASFFWIPAILEKKFVLLSRIPLADKTLHFINPVELLFSPWNYGARPPFQLGWVHLLVFMIGIVSLFLSRGISRKKNLFLGIYIILSIATLMFLTLSISLPIWRLPLLSQIDFPWRLMAPIVFFISFATIFMSERKFTTYLSYILIAIAFFLIPNFAKPESYFNKDDDYYRNIDATTTSLDEFMPVWVTQKPTNRYSQKVEFLKGQGNLAISNYNSQKIEFSLSCLNDCTLKINSIYFPRWIYKLNDTPILPEYQNAGGLVLLNIPSGNYNVSGQLQNTPVRTLGNIASIISIFIAFLFLVVNYFPPIKQRFHLA